MNDFLAGYRIALKGPSGTNPDFQHVGREQSLFDLLLSVRLVRSGQTRRWNGGGRTGL